MIRAIAILGLGLHAAVAAAVYAHALDEYVQAAVISLMPNRVEISMRLTPGAAVFPEVFHSIDTNSDGVISDSEGGQYAQSLLRDVSLSIDGKPLSPEIVGVQFPSRDVLKEGHGAILIKLSAKVPAGGSERQLVFENRHRRSISAYLMNCEAPGDSRLQMLTQRRSGDQSSYVLSYRRVPES